MSTAIAASLTVIAQPRLTLDYAAMARRIVQQLALAPGERVLSVAHPGTFADLMPHVRYEVMHAGAIDLGVLDVLQEPVPESLSAYASRYGKGRTRGTGTLQGDDAPIMMPGANTSHPAYLAMQDWLQDDLKERRGRRTIHFHWVEGASALAGLRFTIAAAICYRRRLSARAAPDELSKPLPLVNVSSWPRSSRARFT